MKFRFSQCPAVTAGALTAGMALFAAMAAGQAARPSNTPAVPQASTQASPFGGAVVEDVIVRVNDQIISRSDYERAEQDLEQRARQQNLTPQQVEAERRDLLRDLVDQQLLLSKAKELDITGETELVHELDDIRKQNHLDTMEDLQKAAESQGVNYEDFKASIRNRIITQQVIRDEVGRHLNLTQADVQRYYEKHKEEFNKPESVRLSEILIPTSAAGDASADPAKATADEIETKLKAGADFDELSKSTGSAAPQGGDLGVYTRGKLAKVLEDQTFALKAGQFTEPIRTKQGYIILKVTEHTPGGQQTLKEVQPQVEDALAQERVQPAVRAYLAQAREEAYIDYKPGYVDTAAVVNPGKPVYSAYVPPSPKKKKKVVRSRYRERGRSAKQTQTATAPAAAPSVPSLADAPHSAPETAQNADTATPANGSATPGAQAATKETATASGAATPQPDAATASGKTRESDRKKSTNVASTMKPGKKEKIRFGQAPRETLPANDNTRNIDAHATADSSSLPAETQVAAADIPPEPEAPKAQKKRYSDRAKLPKVKKPKGPQTDPLAPPPPSPEETATQQTQSTPLGLAGNTAKPPKKKKVKPTEKTRLQDEKKGTAPAQTPAGTPVESGTPVQSPDQATPAASTPPAPNTPATPLGTNPVQTPPTNTQGVPTPGDGSSTTPPPPPQ